jgi:hypothetical protein
MMYKQKKSSAPFTLAVIAVVALAGIGYLGAHSGFAASALAAAGDSNLSVQSTAAAPSTSPDAVSTTRLLSIVAEINSLNLKGGIFNDQAFNSFKTFATPTPQPAGRVDPFAPIPGGSVGTANPF